MTIFLQLILLQANHCVCVYTTLCVCKKCSLYVMKYSSAYHVYSLYTVRGSYTRLLHRGGFRGGVNRGVNLCWPWSKISITIIAVNVHHYGKEKLKDD